MANNTRDLLIRLLGDSSNMKKAMADADGAVSKHDMSLKSLAGTIGSTYAAKQVIDFGKASVEAAAADEASQVKLATALRNTANATDAQIAAAEAWIERTMFATGVTDDELRPALERLTRATGDVNQAQSLMSVAMDVSAGTGKSLQAVTEAMGKAADGNVGALGRLGIATKDASGQTLSFDQIVQNLSSTFAGQSAKAADTAAGRMAIMKARMGELQEQIGTALMPIMEQLVGTLSGVAEWFSNLDEGTQEWIIRIGMLGGGLVLATRAVNGIMGPLKALGIIGATTATQIDGITTKTSGLSKALGLAGVALGGYAGYQYGMSKDAENTAHVLDTLSKTGQKWATISADQMSPALEQFREQLAVAQLQEIDGAEALQVLTEGNIEGARRMLEHAKATGVSTEFTDLLSTAISNAENNIRLIDGTAVKFTGTIEAVTVATDAATDATAAQTTGVDTAARQWVAFGAELEAVQVAEDAATAAAQRAKEAHDAVIESVKSRTELERTLYQDELSRIDKQYAFETQTRALAAAMGEYNTKINDTKTSAVEAEAATFNMAEDIRQAAVAFAASKGAADNSKQSIDLQIQSLYGMAATLDPASPLRTQLLRYIGDLQAIPGNIESTLKLNLPYWLRPGKGGIGVIIAEAGATGIASTKGGLTLVGEQGPELVNMPKGATVFNNTQTMAMLGSRGGGLHVEVHNHGTVLAERDLVRTVIDGILDAQRRGEFPGSFN